MDPSTQRQEHITHAIIGLGIMALATSIFHIYTTSQFWRSAKPPPPGASPQTVDQYTAFLFVTVFLWIALVGAWVIGLSFWITHFGFISIVQRNNSLIGGIINCLEHMKKKKVPISFWLIETYKYGLGAVGQDMSRELATEVEPRNGINHIYYPGRPWLRSCSISEGDIHDKTEPLREIDESPCLVPPLATDFSGNAIAVVVARVPLRALLQ